MTGWNIAHNLQKTCILLQSEYKYRLCTDRQCICNNRDPINYHFIWEWSHLSDSPVNERDLLDRKSNYASPYGSSSCRYQLDSFRRGAGLKIRAAQFSWFLGFFSPTSINLILASKNRLDVQIVASMTVQMKGDSFWPLIEQYRPFQYCMFQSRVPPARTQGHICTPQAQRWHDA